MDVHKNTAIATYRCRTPNNNQIFFGRLTNSHPLLPFSNE